MAIYKEDNITVHNADWKTLEIPDRRVNLIVTDPPYDLQIRMGDRSGMFKNRNGLFTDDMGTIKDSYDIEGFADLAKQIQHEVINAYFFCNRAQVVDYFNAYVNRLGCNYNILCWHKTNAPACFHNTYLSDTEYILHFFTPGHGAMHPQNYEDAKTYNITPLNVKDKQDYGHPTPKPVPLVAKLLRNSSKEGDLVFDPFLGSGTTAVACKIEKRAFIGFEINEKYYKNAVRRIGSTLSF